MSGRQEISSKGPVRFPPPVVRPRRRRRGRSTSSAHTSLERRVLALVGAAAFVFVVFLLLLRPWYLAWGTTDEELSRPLPGDEIVATATFQETRAITINAGVDRIWPWLAQLGQDRGGFYSFDLLENLVGCEMPTSDRLLPERQRWQLGDKLWMYPPDKAGGSGFATLRSHIPGVALGFGTRAVGTALHEAEDGSWSFVLDPIDDSTTRLLVRGRGSAGRSLLGRAFDRTIFEPVHFAMERRTMIGLKQLAERGTRDRLTNHVHVALWMMTFGLLVTAAVLVLRRRHWRRALVGFVASAAVLQVLTLAQPPVLLGALLVAGLAGGLWFSREHRTSPSGIRS